MESRNHVLATAIQEQIVNHLTLINFGIDVGLEKEHNVWYDRRAGFACGALMCPFRSLSTTG